MISVPGFADRLSLTPHALTEKNNYSLALCLAGGALWLVSHPYRGLYQDANLYTLMALHWLNGTAYARDPFFMFGAQDAFSLFSPFHGSLIRVFGVSDASRLLVLVGGVSWLGASWLVAKCMFSDPFPFGVVFLCCAIFSLSYSPAGSTFVLNESFATARVLAIPLGIAAVALGSGSPLSWMMAIVAMALHPLLGVWPLVVLYSTRCSDFKLIALALIAFCALTIAALVGQGDFLRPVSAERWDLLNDSTIDLLVTGADLSRVNGVLFWLGALLFGSQYGEHQFRRRYLIIALLSALAYLLSAFISLYYPIDFLLQIQPWRAIWLAAFFAVVAMVDVAWAICRSGRSGWCYVLFLGSVLLVCKPIAGPLLLLGYVVMRRVPLAKLLPPSFSMTPSASGVLAIAAAMLALPAWLADVRLDGESLSMFGWTSGEVLRGIVGGGAYGVGPVLIVALLMHARLLRGIFLLLLISVVAWTSMCWDTRATPTRTWEESIQISALEMIPGLQPGQTVYWSNRLTQVWFGLGTAGYVGEYHLSGLVFSADRTDLVAARLQRAAVASVVQIPVPESREYDAVLVDFRRQHSERDFGKLRVGNYLADALSVSGVFVLCTDPSLDWVVADFPTVPGGAGVAFEVPWEPGVRHYAYACQSLRSAIKN